MKILVSYLTILSTLLPTFAYAQCDFSKGITKTEPGYLYTPECHKEVGRTVLENDARKDEIKALREALTNKDVIIDTERQRAELWRDTSFKMESRLSSYERWKSENQLLAFGVGVLVTVGAAYSLGQAAKASK